MELHTNKGGKMKSSVQSFHLRSFQSPQNGGYKL